jgi:hypothetical protein
MRCNCNISSNGNDWERKKQRIMSQMEAYGADVNDCSRHLHEGKQRILMDGYQILLEFKNGLAYLRC